MVFQVAGIRTTWQYEDLIWYASSLKVCIEDSRADAEDVLQGDSS